MPNDKLCECGCGQLAPIAKRTNSCDGAIKGHQQRFLRGHYWRGKTGILSSCWKGGRTLNHGYVWIKMPNHSRANKKGYVFEHIEIAERVLGRSLPSRAEVHHVNSVRTENKNSNLVICEDHAYHMALHRRMLAYQSTGNPVSVTCRHCGKWGITGEGDMSTTRRKTGRTAQSYHRKCERQHAKRRYYQEERLCEK